MSLKSLSSILVVGAFALALACTSVGGTNADTDAVPDEDVTSPALCPHPTPVCVATVLTVCDGDAPVPVFDCAAEGWRCEAGHCAATGEESATEAAYRERLTALRLASAPVVMEFDRFGGWLNHPPELGPTSPGEFFRVEKRAGRWWFLTPEGNPFVSKGVTDVNWLGATLAHDEWQQHLVDTFGDEETWADDAAARARDWAFNTIGPWSSYSMTTRMPHAVVILDSAGHAPRYRPGDVITDYWSDGFLANCDKVAEERATPYVDDEHLLGYFLDNELVWAPNGWQTNDTVLQLYVGFPADAPGRAVALDHLRDSAVDLADFNATWGTELGHFDDLAALPVETFGPRTPRAAEVTEAFVLLAFNQYAEAAIDALRAVDPHHLLLGCRFSTYHNDALMRAAAERFDVISIAFYSPVPPTAELDAIAAEVNRPFLIEEFSFKATDSGLLNVLNYAPVVETQRARGLEYDAYVGAFMRRPNAVGYHWYKWFDNPPRPDNILSGDNFGLMNKLDEPYAPFTAMVREVNRRIEWWHYEGPPPAAPQ